MTGSPDSPSAIRFRFGDFQVDLGTRELLEQDKSVSLQPKAFDLLVYLIRNRERAVSKDELQNEIWPNAIVSETALTRCVMKARKAVGDDADAQAVIGTVHGHGYRFVAAVAEHGGSAQQIEPDPAKLEGSESALSERTSTLTPTDIPRERHITGYVLGVVVALAVATLGWWKWPTPSVPSETLKLAVLPILDQTGDSDLSWVRTGMMSLMNRMLKDQGVAVLSESRVTQLSQQELPAALTVPDDLKKALVEAYGATHFVAARVGRADGLLQMTYRFGEVSGDMVERSVIAKEPARLAADAIDNIVNLVGSPEHVKRKLRFVSDDPFVNETYARGLALELEGSIAEAQKYFEVAIDAAPELFWARYEHALTQRDLHDVAAAETEMLALLEEAKSLSAAEEEVSVRNALGVLYYGAARDEEATVQWESALALAMSNEDRKLAGTVRTNLAMLANRTGDRAKALEYYDQAQQDLTARGQPMSGLVLNNVAGIQIADGQFEAAEASLSQAIEQFRLLGQRRYEGTSTNRMGELRRHQGRYDEAIGFHEKALAIRREMSDQAGEASSLLSLAGDYEAKGLLSRSLTLAESGLERSKALDRPVYIADAWRQIATVHMARRRGDRALVALNQAKTARPLPEGHRGAISLNLAFADAYAVNDELLQAHQHADAALAAAIESGRESAIVASHLTKARLQVKGARYGDAEQSIEQALAAANSMGSDLWIARVAEANAELLLLSGSSEDAQRHIELLKQARAHVPKTWQLSAQAAWQAREVDVAISAMERARVLAGEKWSPEDEATLTNYRAAQSAP